MEKLHFDSGVKCYRVGEGVLKFNPCDPNVYARFLEAAEEIRTVEEQLQEQAKALTGRDAGTAAVVLMQEADKKMKVLLNKIFGGDNDFHEILKGVNLLAVAGNGERIITNLFAALQPVLVDGAREFTRQATRDAVEKANLRRSQC